MRQKYKNLFFLSAGLALLLMICAACNMPSGQRKPRLVLFVGVDVSGSFRNSPYYDDAIAFLSHYIYGHLNELGEVSKLRALFVGSIGGTSEDEPKAFHPIHDLEGKDVTQIEEELRKWFPPEDIITDFNAFFEEVAQLTKDRNLTLAPISIIIATDGVPALGTREDKAAYEKISLDPLEYLSRRVTVRLTYLDPIVAKHWRDDVPARRVRIWTVAGEVMVGWRKQMETGIDLALQDKLWKWVKDNVDFRVRARRF
jgi:hypothetical protein